MLLFVFSVAGVLLGLVGCYRLARGMDVLPPRPNRRRTLQAPLVSPRLALIAVAVGVVVLLVTRWPVAAALAAALIVLAPKVVGGGVKEKAAVAKLEALALWTESLRDSAQAASGLEYAIPATVDSAPPLLVRPLRNMTHRLAARVPLPAALAMFADEVDDAGADMVVAALSLNARQRAGSLSRVLSTLAANTRDELEMRRKVMHERNSVRRQSQQIAALALGLAAAQAVLVPEWVAPYATPIGQLVLALFALVFVALVLKLGKLAEPEPQPRFLTNADDVVEVASYKPRSVGV